MRVKTFIYSRYPPQYHLCVSHAKFLKPSAIQVYFALLSVAGKTLDRSPRAFLRERLPLARDTIDKAYNSLLQFGLVEERKGQGVVEITLVPKVELKVAERV